VPQLRVHGNGDKTRCIPLHAGTQELLNNRIDGARHAADSEGALFRPTINDDARACLDLTSSNHAFKAGA
jgi:site-specific recombinase XerC